MDFQYFKDKFNWKEYVNKYEDLQKCNIDNLKKAWKHATTFGYKEQRDIFKGNMDLLNKFRDFCNTGEVKPIPQEECNVEYNSNIFVIDCQPLQHEIRGIGTYGVSLVNELITKYSDKFSFHLIINNFLSDELINNRIITQETTRIHKINFENVEKPLYKERNVYFNSNEIEYEKILANYINNLKPKYFLNLSEFDRRKIMINIDLLNKNIRKFSILYDLIPLKEGYYDTISEKWTINYNKQLNNLKKYDNLLSISEFTKKDCSDVFNNIETIGTVVHDYEYSFSKQHEQSVLKKFNINKKYIYCQTAFCNHKGLSFLYEQYLKLPKVIKNDMLLVFGSNIPENYIKKNNMNDKNVIITGYLSEEDLHILHENAWLFVFPSTYEGFGIPPVEAMKHNKPVIVANNTSLVEVIGNDKFMFNHDEKSCADLITNLYRCQKLYDECIENSIKRKNLFNKEKVLDKFFSIVKSINKKSICFGFKRKNDPNLQFSGINTVCNYIIENCVDNNYFNYSVSVEKGNNLIDDIYFSTYEKFDDEISKNCRIIFIQDIIYLYNIDVRDDEPVGTQQYLTIHNILKSIKYDDYLLFTTNYQINKLKENLNNYSNINPNNIYLYNLPNRLNKITSNVLNKNYEERLYDIVIFSQHAKRKNRDLHLDLVRLLSKKYKIAFIISQQKGNLNKIKNFKKESNSNVTFISSLNDEQMVNIYNNSRFNLFLSKDEGYGLNSLEASCVGCINIVTDKISYNEILESNAIYVDINKDISIIVTFLEGIINYETYSKYIDKQQIIEERFNLINSKNNFTKVVNEIYNDYLRLS